MTVKTADGSQVTPVATDTQPGSQKPANTESATTDTPDALKQAEATREAVKAGESRKRMAESLIRLAATDKGAKAQLKELSKDEYERTYFERKFGDDFKNLIKDDEAPSAAPAPALDPKVQAMVNERETQRNEALSSVKAQLGLTLDQADAFDDLVKKLEGETIGGKTYTYRDAAEIAARQLVPNLPSISAIVRGDVQQRPEDKQETSVPISQARVDQFSDYTGATSPKDFAPMVDQLAKTGSYKLPL